METEQVETVLSQSPPDCNMAEHRAFISVMKLLYVFVAVIFDACQKAVRENEQRQGQLCSQFMQSINKLYKQHPGKFKAYTYILNQLWDALAENRFKPAWDEFTITVITCEHLKQHIITECSRKGIDILREIEIDVVNNRNFFDEGKK